MRANKLRELLRARKPTLGTRLNTASPALIEMLGYTGLYDYVELVGENASYDLHDLDNCCRAAELHGLGTVFKVDYDTRRFLAQRAIGAGFEGVLFTDGHTVDDARESVRICRAETPGDRGLLGAVSRRFSYPEYGGSAEYVQALKQIVVLLMVEKVEMVERLDQVLAVPGIDLIQWGGSDYSMSDGRPGEAKSVETKAAERRVIEAAVKAGVPPRVELASLEEAPYYLDLGVRHFSIGVDTRILYDGWKANGEKVRKLQASL
jgi:4-hydroxy-2-oxoheptanedioate aldolase